MVRVLGKKTAFVLDSFVAVTHVKKTSQSNINLTITLNKKSLRNEFITLTLTCIACAALLLGLGMLNIEPVDGAAGSTSHLT